MGIRFGAAIERRGSKGTPGHYFRWTANSSATSPNGRYAWQPALWIAEKMQESKVARGFRLVTSGISAVYIVVFFPSFSPFFTTHYSPFTIY